MVWFFSYKWGVRLITKIIGKQFENFQIPKYLSSEILLPHQVYQKIILERYRLVRDERSVFQERILLDNLEKEIVMDDLERIGLSNRTYSKIDSLPSLIWRIIELETKNSKKLEKNRELYEKIIEAQLKKMGLGFFYS